MDKKDLNVIAKEVPTTEDVSKSLVDVAGAARTVYVNTGLGKRYSVSITPKGERPILIAVHL